MNCKQFLQWLFNRLNILHGEPVNVDYMRRLQLVIDKLGKEKVNMRCEIPDGKRYPIYFEAQHICAVRAKDELRTYIFIRGEEDPWTVSCPIEEVLALLP